MDFKVKCVNYKFNDDVKRFTVGKIYDVKDNKIVADDDTVFDAWAYFFNGNADFEALKKWFSLWYDFELVEDKKVFTKSDLKNGDVIVRRNGSVEIAIVDLGVLVTKGSWNNLKDLKADLTDCDSLDENEWDIVKVYRPIEKYHCQFSDDAYTKGKLVYDRERDTKPLYNGKVVCVDLCNCNENLYTVGKIYQFKDGKITNDKGLDIPVTVPIYSIDDWNKFSDSKFIEIKE